MNITLADGCFDPLHSGHMVYLNACKALGGDLIVQVSEQTKRREFLPLALRMYVLDNAGFKCVCYPTTARAIRELRPNIYVKGADWCERGVPEADICRAFGTQVVFVDTPPGSRDSSTARLQSWASRTAEAGLDELADLAQRQTQIPFNAEAQGYTYEARVKAEGEHPRILAELCQGKTVLDVGCGPGHFVRMLREAGVLEVWGVDPNVEGEYQGEIQGEPPADLVVCREVLEHLPVRELGAFVYHLFRVARERVYITTRFTAAPRHPFDLTTEFNADPSHITLLPQPLVRALCVLNGGVRDVEWEEKLDWQHKGRVLVYKVGA